MSSVILIPLSVEVCPSLGFITIISASCSNGNLDISNRFLPVVLSCSDLPNNLKSCNFSSALSVIFTIPSPDAVFLIAYCKILSPVAFASAACPSCASVGSTVIATGFSSMYASTAVLTCLSVAFSPCGPRLGFPVSVPPICQFSFSPICGVIPFAPGSPSFPGLPSLPFLTFADCSTSLFCTVTVTPSNSSVSDTFGLYPSSPSNSPASASSLTDCAIFFVSSANSISC